MKPTAAHPIGHSLDAVLSVQGPEQIVDKQRQVEGACRHKAKCKLIANNACTGQIKTVFLNGFRRIPTNENQAS